MAEQRTNTKPTYITRQNNAGLKIGCRERSRIPTLVNLLPPVPRLTILLLRIFHCRSSSVLLLLRLAIKTLRRFQESSLPPLPFYSHLIICQQGSCTIVSGSERCRSNTAECVRTCGRAAARKDSCGKGVDGEYSKTNSLVLLVYVV